MRITERVIIGIVVNALFEKLVDVEWNLATIILHANTIEESTFAIYIRNI